VANSIFDDAGGIEIFGDDDIGDVSMDKEVARF
jgi:hypothetical protein